MSTHVCCRREFEAALHETEGVLESVRHAVETEQTTQAIEKALKHVERVHRNGVFAQSAMARSFQSQLQIACWLAVIEQGRLDLVYPIDQFVRCGFPLVCLCYASCLM